MLIFASLTGLSRSLMEAGPGSDHLPVSIFSSEGCGRKIPDARVIGGLGGTSIGLSGLFFTSSAVAYPLADGMPFWRDGDGIGHMMVGGTFMLLFLILLVVIILALIRWISRSGPSNAPSALRILEERYARGEIDHDEFVERKRQLTY